MLRVDHARYEPPKKKKAVIEEEIAAGIEVELAGAGHAYKGKDLASSFDLSTGVDLWKKPESGLKVS